MEITAITKNLHTPSFLFLCFFLLLTGACASHHHHHHAHHRNLFGFRPTKLFVFGDSYADTGNNPLAASNSWKVPYGATFPGKPAGRFSDGRVLTDYLAKFVGVKTPIAYRWWKRMGVLHLRNGMNFAYGGSGVFETLAPLPNMTAQIGFFKKLIDDSLYTPADIRSSAALVTLSGNDYSAYLQRNGSVQGLQSFITTVVNQLAANLKLIQGLGVKRIAVAALQPLGCLPPSTASSSYQQCDEAQNGLVGFHNLLLQQAVTKLNHESKYSTFIVLDLYTSFMSVLNATHSGGSKFENPLKPCCVGTSMLDYCGSVDEKGVKKYTVCENPESAFFWDGAHPTQAGWEAVYASLHTTLQQLLY